MMTPTDFKPTPFATGGARCGELRNRWRNLSGIAGVHVSKFFHAKKNPKDEANPQRQCASGFAIKSSAQPRMAAQDSRTIGKSTANGCRNRS